MNPILLLLLLFVLLGLLGRRLGKATYVLLGCLVVVYVVYTYGK